MNSFDGLLKEEYIFSKYAESRDPKEQNFFFYSEKTWNQRKSGLQFSEQSDLKSNQIIFVELGKSYSPELAYAHPCLLLNYNDRLCKILPITSSNSITSRAYHPVINPSGTKTYFLIPANTCALTKDSAVYVRQYKTISESRIIKYIDKNGLPIDMYKAIRDLAFKDCFDDFHYKIAMLQRDNIKLKDEIETLKQELSKRSE